MALTITALDARDGTDQTFSSRSVGNWIDTSSTMLEPRTLSVKHTVSGKDSAAVDRHLIQLAHRKMNTSGAPKDLIVNLTVAVPRDSVVTTAMVEDAIANIVSLVCNHAFSTTTGFTNDTVIQQILRGEQ